MAKRVHRRLSEREITAAKAPKGAKLARYADGGNLFLCVSKTGAKWWSFRFQRDGRHRELGLGPLEDVDSAAARERAAEARKLLREGRDPVTELGKRARKTAPRPANEMFRAVAEDTIRALAAGWSNEKTPAQWRSSLEAYAFGRLGDLRVSEIATADVYAVLEPIWSTKPETAARLRARIEAVLDRAGALKLRFGENPARWRGNLDALLAPRAKVRRVEHHAALDYREVGAFMALLAQREGPAARALEFAVLTAGRTSEVLGATWDEIDLGKRVWTLAPERMKARREHRVPLSDAAIELLERLPREDGSEFVFIGPRAGRALSNMAMLKLLERMGRDDLTVHGMRSAFRTWAAERTSFPSELAELALAHQVGSAVERAYRRADMFEKRVRLMSAWAAFCARPAPSSSDNIRQIREPIPAAS